MKCHQIYLVQLKVARLDFLRILSIYYVIINKTIGKRLHSCIDKDKSHTPIMALDKDENL